MSMSNRVRVALLVVLSLIVVFACEASLAMAQSSKQKTDAQSAKEETSAQKSAKQRAGTKNEYTDTFPSEVYSTTGENPYVVLQPGYQLILDGKEGKTDVHLEITVTEDTEMVDGEETRVVEEREFKNDVLFEVSRNYFVIGQTTNSVFYFGEDVEFYDENGNVTSSEGSWRSGENGARYGLQMPGIVLAGSRYFQEVAPEAALDRAEHVRTTATVETPAGTFQNSLKVRETTPLEPKAEEFKFHAPGVGLVKDGPLELTCYGFGTCPTN
jgi:hypothetical protein